MVAKPVSSALEGRQGAGWVRLAQENGLELVHASVGEQQRGVAQRDDRRGRDMRVRFGHEEVNEALADLCRTPGLRAHTQSHHH